MINRKKITRDLIAKATRSLEDIIEQIQDTIECEINDSFYDRVKELESFIDATSEALEYIKDRLKDPDLKVDELTRYIDWFQFRANNIRKG